MAPLAPTQPSTSPRNVLVTGASGYLGRLVVDGLLKQRAVQRIVALDRVRPPTAQQDPRVTHIDRDVCLRIDDVAEVYELDTLIHLAYPLDHVRSYRQIRPFSLDATLHVLHAAAVARARKVVLCSSTTIYGGHRWKRGQWNEGDRPKPNAGYHYARGKCEMEAIANAWAERHKDCELILLRPCVVLGPHTENYMVQDLFGQEHRVRGHDPRMQFLHEEDFASAVDLLLQPGTRGTFNLTPNDEGVTRSELSRLLGFETVELSLFALQLRLLWRWWTRGPSSPAVSPAVARLLAYSWSASNHRLRDATGFAPRFSSEDAVLEFFKAYRKRHRTARRESP